MIVPSIAPTWRYAARPEKTWLDAYADPTTNPKRNTAMSASIRSTRQATSYSTHASPSPRRLRITAAAGSMSRTDLSTR
jgi:hypothetical protein